MSTAKKIPFIKEPSAEELKRTFTKKYDAECHAFMDHWPQAIHDVSIPSKRVQIPHELLDIDFLNKFFDNKLDRLKPPYDHSLSFLIAYLDTVMGWTSHFLRLNTRSPKDIAPNGLPITCSGKQFLHWMTGSERMLDDLMMLSRAEKPAYIYMRELMPMPKSNEFRCFAKADKGLIGISQYDYDNHHSSLESIIARDTIAMDINEFYREHIYPYYPGDIVFDVLNADWNNEIILIELNPYGLSDPCCFGDYDRLESGNAKFAFRRHDGRFIAEDF